MKTGGDGFYYGLQGLNALLEPGMYPVHVEGVLKDGTPFYFSQWIPVLEREYIFEYINVAPELIDPETTAREIEFVSPFLAPITPEKRWQGAFLPPSPFADCINSSFGNRRSYNGSAFTYFHGGVDYCGGTGVQITAPAPGTVIFAGPLEIRGNFTIIDHGWGVYTTYMHQDEILVEAGESVETGQLIGYVGNTGRSTGPHLHWEVWVNGVNVNPLDWVENPYP